jgi:hypothetical protein
MLNIVRFCTICGVPAGNDFGPKLEFLCYPFLVRKIIPPEEQFRIRIGFPLLSVFVPISEVHRRNNFGQRWNSDSYPRNTLATRDSWLHIWYVEEINQAIKNRVLPASVRKPCGVNCVPCLVALCGTLKLKLCRKDWVSTSFFKVRTRNFRSSMIILFSSVSTYKISQQYRFTIFCCPGLFYRIRSKFWRCECLFIPYLFKNKKVELNIFSYI